MNPVILRSKVIVNLGVDNYLSMKGKKAIYFSAELFYHAPQNAKMFWTNLLPRDSQGYILKVAAEDSLVDKFEDELRKRNAFYISFDL